MNKAELIMKVSERANVTQKLAKVIVDTLFDGMMESLEKGERIENPGIRKLCRQALRRVQGPKPQNRGDCGCSSQEIALLQGGERTEGDGEHRGSLKVC